MVLSLLAAAILGALMCAASGIGADQVLWAVAAGTAGLLLAIASRARPLYAFLALTFAAIAWAPLLPEPSAGPGAPAPQGGLARLTLDVGRTACGDGCWAEARLVTCEPIEPDTCFEVGSYVSVASPDELPVGARVALLAKVASRPEFRNPGGPIAWPDLRARVRASLAPGASVRIVRLHALDRAVHWLRGRLRSTFDRSLRAPHAGIARALLLGEGSAVDAELNAAIRDAGVSHVLAVSGMHVTVLAGALVALVRVIWLRTPLALYFEAARAAAAVGVPLSPLVARVCGGSPSAWRAAVTSMLMFGLVALGVRPNALSVSALAVIAYALADPRDALHPGFILSVLATAALLTAPRRSAGLLAAFLESLRAWLATAPFLAFCFGTSSLIALVANVVLLPLGGLLIPLVVAHLLAALGSAHELLATAWVFETASGAFVAASRVCAGLDPGLSIPPLTRVQGLAALMLAAIWLLARGVRPRLVVSVLALLLAGTSEACLRRELSPASLRVSFLDVGQGDGVLLESGGRSALIDAGGSTQGSPDPGAAVVVPLLRARRVTRLDLVVLSHPHPDHYGGLDAVLRGLSVAELWDTGQAEAEGPDGPASRLLTLARERGVRVRRPDQLCGREHAFGRARLRVLAPCPAFDDALGPNDNSFVVQLEHGQHRFLFTGDVEREAERGLVAAHAGRLRSDVLKVPHHGSRTSSTPALLAAVQPWLSVISAGRGNRFGHPHRDVVERLQASGHHVLSTDVVGGVRVESDGRRLRVEAWDPGVQLAR